MTPRSNELYAAALKAMPKIDLHRHLEGSLRLGTLTQIARDHGVDVPVATTAQLRPLVQMTKNDPANLEHFLAKFEVLRRFYHSDEAIARLTYEAIVDAAADNVHYLELRFSPQALARKRGFPLADVTDWVIEAAHQASRVYEIELGLIVTLLRHEDIALAEKVAHIAFARRHKGIVGIDLAGNEIRFPCDPFKHIFAEAQQLGLGITVHAGEVVGGDTIRTAIEDLHAQRLGHGVRVIDDPNMIAMVKERGTALEMCLVSNLQTGAVSSLAQHPARALLDAGVRVTLNTDDPSVSDSDLSDEFLVGMQEADLSYNHIRQAILNAAAAAFLPLAGKERLVDHFEQLLPRPVLGKMPTFS
ncbi:MAG: adenosine deaminase [Chloroflexi bacterium]|nr:adenosine deaminase [Chloroflexota bacterium]MBP8057536.1 adenosine deaminase [Chloroflexota bacterium]